MSSCHYGKTQGRATGVEKLKEAEKWLFYIKLWRNAGVLSLARGRPHFSGTSKRRPEQWEEPTQGEPQVPLW